MSDQAQELYIQALKKHRAQEYSEAVTLLERAVELDPGHSDSWEALGVLYDKVERLDDAIAAMRKLIELAPEEIMAWTNLSRFLMKDGQIRPAEEAQAKARTLGWKADLAAGNVAGGDDDFRQAGPGGEPGPSAPSAPVDLAGMAAQAPSMPTAPAPPDPEKIERKIRQFEAILEANPQDALARLTLGKTFLQCERYDDAVRVVRELLALDADRSAAYPILGEAYEKLGKRARAMSTYEDGIEVATRKGDLHPRNIMQEALERLR